MKNIWTIVKKELRRFFTDKRLVLTLFLPGLLIYGLYSIMGNAITNITSTDEEHTYEVYVQNEPEGFTVLDETDAYDIDLNIVDENTNLAEVKNQIESKDVDLLIIYDADFINKIENYDSTSGEKAPQVQMYYNSTSNESSAIYSYYSMSLATFESSQNNLFDINNDADTQFNLATDDDISISIITSMLPFLIIMLLFSSCMAITPDSIAGEKERGTIATLLVTPMKRSELAIGKVISLSIIGLCSSVCSFIGVMASLPKLFAGANVSLDFYGPGTYLAVLAVIFVSVLLFIVLLAIISALSKSIKEAGTYATPLMIIVMLLGISNMFLGDSIPATYQFFIPVYNSVICLNQIFSMEFNTLNFVITVVVNLVLVGGGVFALTKMFNSEKIMFNK